MGMQERNQGISQKVPKLSLARHRTRGAKSLRNARYTKGPMQMTNPTRFSPTTLLVGILLGGVIGASGMHLYSRHRAAMAVDAAKRTAPVQATKDTADQSIAIAKKCYADLMALNLEATGFPRPEVPDFNRDLDFAKRTENGWGFAVQLVKGNLQNEIVPYEIITSRPSVSFGSVAAGPLYLDYAKKYAPLAVQLSRATDPESKAKLDSADRAYWFLRKSIEEIERLPGGQSAPRVGVFQKDVSVAQH